jgi:hypothetical protein
MVVAWLIIKVHEVFMDRAALALVTQQLSAGGPEALAASKDLGAAIRAAKAQLAASKGFVARFLSLKAAHGVIMFVSWINVAGAQCTGGRKRVAWRCAALDGTRDSGDACMCRILRQFKRSGVAWRLFSSTGACAPSAT